LGRSASRLRSWRTYGDGPIRAGLVGSAVLGQLFDRFGWPACVAGIGLSLILAAILAVRLKMTTSHAMALAQ